MIYFILWIFFSFMVGAIGSDKSIGFWGGFFVSLILSPLIGLIIVLVSKEKAPPIDDPKILPLKPVASTNKPESNADEIAKFKSLLDSGAITQEEFETAKATLLNNL